MTKFDKIYKTLCEEIIRYGNDSSNSGNVRTKYADGEPAHYKYLIGYNFRLKVDWNKPETFPIITSRRTPLKSAVNEMFWIAIFQSNNVDDLVNKLNCNFWNEWRREDGTIGEAYGAQFNKPTFGYNSQLEYVIETLRKDPNSRRCITEIWNPVDLNKMALTPCVHLTQWSVVDGELYLQVNQRSCDVALGLISNVFQYSILQKLVADELGLKVGELIWNIHNAHLYDRHISGILKQIYNIPTTDISKFKLHIPEMPKLTDMRNKLDEYHHIPKSIYIEGYDYSAFPKYDYEIAI